MAGAPEGNQNSTREKRIMNAALKRHLVQNPESAALIVKNMVEAAMKGEPWAVKEVFDRESGKPKQPLTGGDVDDTPITIQKIERVLVRANTPDTNG
jgi:hypothetical protein